MVGCPLDETPVGYPNAHFNFNRETCDAINPAAAAGWNRVFERSTPHPFHDAPRAGSASGGLLAHLFGMFCEPPCAALPSGRLLMNSATVRCWSSLKAGPGVGIWPDANFS